MNIEDIKVGETYNVRVKVLKKENGKHIITNTLDSDGWINSACTTTFLKEELSAFSPITPEPTPTHDPCRRFRKGDKVRFKEYHGRKAVMYSGTNSWFNHPPSCKNGILVVKEDEKDSRVKIGIITADCAHATTAPCYLELVTPVEEMEPYIIEESTDGATIVLTVKKRCCSQGLDFRYCPGWGGNIFFSENHCRNHAEAECARLNAEYRKEQNNG